MRKFKCNQGITLVELMITIAIGSVVTLAALSLLLMGLRLHRKSTDTALRQNEIQVAITLMEKLVTENTVATVEETAVKNKEKANILYFQGNTIYTGANMAILEDVSDFSAALKNSLITITMTVDGNLYEFKVYCRITASSTSEDAVLFSNRREATPEEVLTQVLEDSSVSYGVRQFLHTLSSQLGSTGRIQTAEGEGEYFSQWYIGSYEANPGWNQDTPWCACFVSWALEENSHLMQGATMRFADVDAFWAEFVTTDRWKTENPEPGNIVFFDWIIDDERNAQHVGVVVDVCGEWLYTLEGNTDGVVALRKYLVEDARILGYGIPNWR